MYQQFFKFLFQNSRDAVFLIGGDGKIIEANDTALNVYGYDRNEMLYLRFNNLCAPKNLIDLNKEIDESSNKTEKIESLHRRKDGNDFQAEILMKSSQMGKEKFLLVIVRSKDKIGSSGKIEFAEKLTELKIAYEELKIAYEELAKTTFDSLMDIGKLLVSKKEEKLAREKAEILSSTDYLTGLLNRRAFEERVDYEIKKCKRDGKSLGIMLIDIDHFKKINDTYGHQAGDMILKEFATFLLRNCRANDFLGRYGGEEFIICLPGLNEGEALKIADRIRQSIEEHVIHVPGIGTMRITASFGVAVMKKNEVENINSLIERADQALYQAKSEGRNCCRYKE